MATKISINRVTNANIYLEGESMLGRAEEVSPPVIKAKMSEHKALGMVGALEYPSGIDKMEMKIKWNSMYPEVLKKTGNPYKSVKLQVRSSIEVFEDGSRSEQKPVVIYITGQFKEIPMGSFKPQDNVEMESTLSVTYCKMEIAGEVITEIDVEANIWIQDGEDLLAQYRQNLGI